jgi:hypothetical protein
VSRHVTLSCLALLGRHFVVTILDAGWLSGCGSEVDPVLGGLAVCGLLADHEDAAPAQRGNDTLNLTIAVSGLPGDQIE